MRRTITFKKDLRIETVKEDMKDLRFVKGVEYVVQGIVEEMKDKLVVIDENGQFVVVDADLSPKHMTISKSSLTGVEISVGSDFMEGKWYLNKMNIRIAEGDVSPMDIKKEILDKILSRLGEDTESEDICDCEDHPNYVNGHDEDDICDCDNCKAVECVDHPLHKVERKHEEHPLTTKANEECDYEYADAEEELLNKLMDFADDVLTSVDNAVVAADIIYSINAVINTLTPDIDEFIHNLITDGEREEVKEDYMRFVKATDSIDEDELSEDTIEALNALTRSIEDITTTQESVEEPTEDRKERVKESLADMIDGLTDYQLDIIEKVLVRDLR